MLELLAGSLYAQMVPGGVSFVFKSEHPKRAIDNRVNIVTDACA